MNKQEVLNYGSCFICDDEAIMNSMDELDMSVCKEHHEQEKGIEQLLLNKMIKNRRKDLFEFHKENNNLSSDDENWMYKISDKELITTYCNEREIELWNKIKGAENEKI